VSGLRWDPQMPKTIAELKCGVIVMHMRGRPEEWRTLPPPGDIVLQVKRELREWAESAVLAGVRRERIVLDPGFGFGKNFEQNYPLAGALSGIAIAGIPAVGRHVKKIIYRPHAGKRWERRSRF
jgi:dihydropteroate synthase